MKHFFQLDSNDCGPTCLYIVANFYGLSYKRNQIRELFTAQKDGVSVNQIVSISKHLGLACDSYLMPTEEFEKLDITPCIVLTRNNHFIVVEKKKSKKIYILDPAQGKYSLALDSFKDLVNIEENKVGLIYFSEAESQPKFTPSSDSKNVSFFSILGYLASNKKDVFFIFTSLVLVSFFQICIPLITKIFFDSIQTNTELSTLVLLMMAQLVVIIFRSIVDFARSFVSIILSSEIHWALLKNFLLKFRSLSYATVNQKSIGDSLQRMQDLLTLKSFISNQFFTIAFAIFHIILYSFLLLTKVPIAFVVFFIGTSVFLLWTMLFLKKRKRLDYSRFELAGKEKNLTYSYFSSFRDIYLFNSSRFFDNKIARQIQQSYILDKKTNRLMQIQGLGATIINESKNLIILLICATDVIHGALTLGDLFAISVMLGMLSQPTMQILGFIYSYQDSVIAMERLNELNLDVKHPNQLKENERSFDDLNALEARNIEYYIDGNNILRNISFYLSPGESLALVGASGSGKSTLARIISRLVTDYKGNLFLNNVNVEHLEIQKYNSMISAVFHDSPVFNLSIVENITMSESQHIDREKLDLALKISGLDVIVKTLNRGLETVHGDSISFSAGQKQRVVIARAIYKGGDIILIDEATNALDTQSEIQLIRSLIASRIFKQVILISHREQVIKQCTNILLLEKGEPILNSKLTFDTIKSTHYKELFDNYERSSN